ncbi:unnamed protein product [Merluccius merluccius]
MSCWLWKDTLDVAEEFLSLCGVRTRPSALPPSESARAMQRLTQQMERQHGARFHAIAQTFLCQCGPDHCASLRRVMDELAGDGKLTWGRVVALFTFTGVLARQLLEREGANLGLDPVAGGQPGQEPGGSCRGLAETIADYLGEVKKDWLLENGGWEGFCKFSCIAGDVNQDSSMKTVLFAAAGVGMMFGLMFLLVR